jgi:hypothetical protein
MDQKVMSFFITGSSNPTEECFEPTMKCIAFNLTGNVHHISQHIDENACDLSVLDKMTVDATYQR